LYLLSLGRGRFGEGERKYTITYGIEKGGEKACITEGETSLRCLATVEMESFFPRPMFARHLTIRAIIKNQSQGRQQDSCHHTTGVAAEEVVTLCAWFSRPNSVTISHHGACYGNYVLQLQRQILKL